MMKYVFTGAVGLAVVACIIAGFPDMAMGQVAGNLIKTPPLKDSDVFPLPIEYHVGRDIPNFAGLIVQMHVLDAAEVDVDMIIPSDPGIPPITYPFGPRSQNVQSVPMKFTAWLPPDIIQQSGINLVESERIPLFDVQLHAKNTDPINNSDTDIVVNVWNIRHIGPGAGSTIIGLQPSDFVYGNPGTNPIQMSHFPTDPPYPGQGIWYHLTETKTFHLLPGLGSAFYATLATTVGIGIEHVPEPASITLILCGAVAARSSWRSRRRRKKQEQA